MGHSIRDNLSNQFKLKFRHEGPDNQGKGDTVSQARDGKKLGVCGKKQFVGWSTVWHRDKNMPNTKKQGTDHHIGPGLENHGKNLETLFPGQGNTKGPAENRIWYAELQAVVSNLHFMADFSSLDIMLGSSYTKAQNLLHNPEIPH